MAGSIRSVTRVTPDASERAAPLPMGFGDRKPSMPVRRTAAAGVFGTLLAEIVSLALPPGTALADKGLAERLGVGRTPVREALIRLAELGLVDVVPQSGTYVSRIPLAAIPEAVLVRRALEGICVAAAAARAPSEGVAELDTAIRRQRVAMNLGDAGLFHEWDERFHIALAALGGYPGIWRLTAQAKLQIDRARRLTLPAEGRMERVVAEHDVIRDAVAAGDAAGACAALDGHLSAVIPDAAELQHRFPGYFA